MDFMMENKLQDVLVLIQHMASKDAEDGGKEGNYR